MYSEKDEEVQERDEFRKDRAKERQRERNIARAAPDKRFLHLCCHSVQKFSFLLKLHDCFIFLISVIVPVPCAVS